MFLVEIAGFEPATYTLRTYRAANCAISPYILQDVNPAILVGTNGLEPSTSCMSSKRSNQLSYAPVASLIISVDHLLWQAFLH